MLNDNEVRFVDLYAQYLALKEDIDLAIRSTIEQSAFIRSKSVDLFEESFSQVVGNKYCVSCANGTDALYIALKGLGIKPGDEVITTSHSWISTSETITQAGGKVVFCDTDDAFYTIDPKLISDKITKNTVGIIPVHLYGHPANMTEISYLAKKNSLWLIEDCAQSHLATHQNQTVGTFGEASTFSFYPGKNLGAMGDAGCLNTNNLELAKWAQLFARHGGKGVHSIEGINSRLDGIQAAILNVKLPYLKSWNDKRISIAKVYNDNLGSVEQLILPKVLPGNKHVYHLYVVRTKQRDQLKLFLEQNHIPTVINYPRILPLLPAYSYLGHIPEHFPISAKYQSEILSLPIYPEMPIDHALYVCEKIKEFFKR